MTPGLGQQGKIAQVRGSTHYKFLMTFAILDGPSMVYVNIFVRSFSKIDDVKIISYIKHIGGLK